MLLKPLRKREDNNIKTFQVNRFFYKLFFLISNKNRFDEIKTGSSKTVQIQISLFVTKTPYIGNSPSSGAFICKMFLKHHNPTGYNSRL